MKIFLTYFMLEYKKCIKVWKKSVAGMMILLTVLILGVAAVSSVLLQSQVFQIINVAVAVPEGEKMTRQAAQLIASMDSVKSVCRFQYMDRETALRKMQDGDVQAVIDLPENFYEDVDSGKNTPACIYFPEQTTLPVELFRELLTNGVNMLQTAEAGVYALLNTADEYPAGIEKSEIGNQAALIYMSEIMRRDGVFEKSVCSPIGTVDDTQYYFSAIVLLALLMGGLNYGFLYQKQGKAVAQKLVMYGMGNGKMSLVKISVMTGVLWITALLFYLAGCIVSLAADYDFLHFHVGTVLGLLLLCAAIAAYFHAVYAVAGGSQHGAAVTLSVNLLMIICSGLLVPAAYLPDIVGRLGAWLPLNTWNQYHLELMFGVVSGKEVVRMLGWLAAGTGIGAVSLWKNT